jgi:signal transduction histidine kinase
MSENAQLATSRFWRTLRFRVTLLNAGVFGAILLLFCGGLYSLYHRNQAVDFDALVLNRAQGIARSVSINTTGQIEINEALIAESGRLLPYQVGNEYIELRAPDGRSIARSRSLGPASLPFDQATLRAASSGTMSHGEARAIRGAKPFWGEGALRVLTLPLVAQGRVHLILQLGVSTHALDASLARLRTILFYAGVPVSLALAFLGGWWIAGRAFQPVNRVLEGARRLGAQRLGERLPVPRTDDELRRLTLTLNRLLDEIERAFQSQQRFVADASHELKTPLTILRGEIEVLRRKEPSPEEAREFLASAAEELERLTQIVENLLLLARADAGRPLNRSLPTPLDEVAVQAVERLMPFSRAASIRCTVNVDDSSGDPVVGGDPDLLASLVFNLVHNAIKHSAAGQPVEIFVGVAGGACRVSVRDHGMGIRPENLPHLFERFSRARTPSPRGTQGTGLGLAISKWIVEAHGGHIEVESRPAEGSTFTITLPRFVPPS